MAEDDLSGRFFKLSPQDQADLIQRSNPQGRQRIIGWLKGRPKTPVSPTLLQSRQAASKSTAEAYSPESTAGTRTREAAIGVLEPFTIQNLYRTGKELAHGFIADPLTGKGTARGMEALTGMVTGPIDPMIEYTQAAQAGDWDRAAHAAGGMLSQTAPAVAGAAEMFAGPETAAGADAGLSLTGKLRVKSRQMAQRALGAGAKKTTGSIVDRYLKKADDVAEKQVASDADIRQRNLESRQAAQRENTANQFKYKEATTKAQQEAVTKNAEAEAKHRAESSAIQEQNRQAQQVKARTEAVETGAERGSERFGEQVSQLDQDLRAEGNAKYDVVHQATANDPGVPAGDIARAVQYAEDSLLKGSSESIKQFRELGTEPPRNLRAEEIDPQRGAEYRSLIQQIREATESLSFDQLQGYSSELAAKLAKGNLLGDVYQAMKYVKDALDQAKRTIAERNGAGQALTEADGFWHNYMDLFYDKDSAIAQVRERVGSLDPQYYSEPVVKGKATDVARGKLYQMQSQHAPRLRQLADSAKQLRDLQSSATVSFEPGSPVPLAEAARTVNKTPSPLPEKPAAVQPKDVRPPEPVATKTTPLRQIPKPKPPTVEEFLESKRRAVERASDKFAEANKWDLRLTVGAIMGMVRHLSLLPEIGIPILTAEKAAAAGLSRPAVIARITQLTPADLAEIERLPEAAKGPLRTQIHRMLQAEERAHRLSPSLQRFLAGAGAAQPPANRREALERLGRPTP